MQYKFDGSNSCLKLLCSWPGYRSGNSKRKRHHGPQESTEPPGHTNTASGKG